MCSSFFYFFCSYKLLSFVPIYPRKEINNGQPDFYFFFVFLINCHTAVFWTLLISPQYRSHETPENGAIIKHTRAFHGRFPNGAFFLPAFSTFFPHRASSNKMCWKRRVYVNKCSCSALYLTTHACFLFKSQFSFSLSPTSKLCWCFTFHITNNGTTVNMRMTKSLLDAKFLFFFYYCFLLLIPFYAERVFLFALRSDTHNV